jgi:hypothetical protein
MHSLPARVNATFLFNFAGASKCKSRSDFHAKQRVPAAATAATFASRKKRRACCNNHANDERDACTHSPPVHCIQMARLGLSEVHLSLLLWLAGWLPRARSRPAATPSIQACTCSHIANLPLRSTFHLLSAHILLAFSAHCFTSVATDLLIKVGNVSRLCFPVRPQLAVPISSIEMCEVDLRREDFPCFYQCTQPKR